MNLESKQRPKLWEKLLCEISCRFTKKREEQVPMCCNGINILKKKIFSEKKSSRDNAPWKNVQVWICKLVDKALILILPKNVQTHRHD